MVSQTKKKSTVMKAKHKDLLFYCLMIAFPVLQFCIFYIGVNFNSLLLAFQDITLTTSGYVSVWTFDNIRAVFRDVFHSPMLLTSLGRSVEIWILTVCILPPLQLMFAYYISKKLPLGKAYRVLLFIPSIISSVVMVTIFQFFVEIVVPDVLAAVGVEGVRGLIENPSSRFATIMFYSIFMGFGSNTLIYGNVMSGISEEVIEAAHLDGATGLKEFWHITLPSIFPTLATFLVIQTAGIFTNGFNLYTFYQSDAPESLYTYGYYLYINTLKATNAEYPYLAAMGLFLTLITAPVTFLLRWAFDKFGPTED